MPARDAVCGHAVWAAARRGVFAVRADIRRRAVPAVSVSGGGAHGDLVFSDAEPGCGAAVSGAFFLAWQVCAGHSDARAFFSEISQKNFENPLCKMQKMVYNDL
jgi:hypothetical protein